MPLRHVPEYHDFMFIVARLLDTVKVEPIDLPLSKYQLREERRNQFSQGLGSKVEATEDELDNAQCQQLEERLKSLIQDKFVDKIVPEVGLVVAFLEFNGVKDAVIQDGRSCFKVDFNVVAFCPFVNEVIDGTLVGSDASGLTVSVEFYRDIKIPPQAIHSDRYFDADSQTWFWTVDEDTNLPYALGNPIRLRVTDTVFNRPVKLGDRHRPMPIATAPSEEPVEVSSAPSEVAAMIVVGTSHGDGLGMLAWWSP